MPPRKYVETSSLVVCFLPFLNKSINLLSFSSSHLFSKEKKTTEHYLRYVLISMC